MSKQQSSLNQKRKYFAQTTELFSLGTKHSPH